MKEQKAYIGKDSLNSLVKELRELNPRRLFFIHGKKSYEQCGAKEEFEKIIESSSIAAVSEFSDFSVNPEFNDLQEALKRCDEFRPDLIMAVGGGSAIDMAKLTRFFYSYQGDIEKGQYDRKSRLVPLIAIPTTSGTGAEATHFAVIYKGKTKYSVEHEDVLPDIAVVYPSFTYNNPPYLTACTGFDALAQGIEAYWNKNATEESDEYAKKAIELIYPNLPLAVKSPTEEVRDKMAEGSYWAGRAINITKTTAPHAFSYPFTSFYGYPHGHAVALVFPIIFEFNLKYGKIPNDKKDYLLHSIKLHEDNAFSAINTLANFIGLNVKDIEYDMETIKNGINVQRLANNPALITIKNSECIIYKILRTLLPSNGIR